MLSNTNIKIPKRIKIRDYQKQAIQAWLSNSGCGVFEMATGTGKTITSICGMVKLLEQFQTNKMPCGLVIVLPYKVLLEQWEEALSEFGIYPLACYESRTKWLTRAEKSTDLFNKGHKKNLFLITTNATFFTDDFQEVLNSIKGNFMFCVDELHHLTSEKAISKLPSHATFRLGLSATLMSKWDMESMEKLIGYFKNGIVYEFTLKRAIEEGYLTPYYYHPIFVDLTDDEKLEYQLLSKKIGRVLNKDDSSDNNEILQSLLMKRARIINTAQKKYDALKSMKSQIVGTKYNLFYCGDTIEADERYVEKINKLLAFNFRMKTHTFTSTENKEEREYVLDRFSRGEIEAITAIRCLDEGVDIPQLRRAFILSSGTNPREFVQRRGRILRKSEGKEFAEIYDFFVVPTLDEFEIRKMSSDELRTERKIINREFERFTEFADLAINKEKAYKDIIKIWNLYNNVGG